ncbi:hypothetical protein [Candidatus Methanoperedens nitratireducens]|uniref:Uncharacterized protein n=1 Tax=Candidatus Methanoperedens nitratireducens TaxID=1392998 RepID=A0A284VRI1_9EURY|nr:hypothetical protein [Candidatus Methanoperedens nitroreducens]SNQ61891.1 hypothetical protein MNV_510007 [Candidatus Methanoperedens nitroreducens]
MTGPQDEFDAVVMPLLNVDEEEARELRNAIMNLNYEELYLPLWRRHEEFMRTTKRTYIILIVLLSIVTALDLIRLFRWW